MNPHDPNIDRHEPLPQPVPLEYRAPTPSEIDMKTAFAVGMWAGIVATELTLLVAIINRMRAVFQGVKMELPAATLAALQLGRAFNAAGWIGWMVLWSFPILAAAATAVLTQNLDGRTRGRVKTAVRYLSLLISASIVVWAVLAVFRPMVSLMAAMGDGQTKR